MGDSNFIDFIPVIFAVFLKICVFESLMNDGKNGFEMRAGSDFWNDAAVALKDIDLRYDDVTQDFWSRVFIKRIAGDDGGGSFVAGRLDA